MHHELEPFTIHNKLISHMFVILTAFCVSTYFSFISCDTLLGVFSNQSWTHAFFPNLLNQPLTLIKYRKLVSFILALLTALIILLAKINFLTNVIKTNGYLSRKTMWMTLKAFSLKKKLFYGFFCILSIGLNGPGGLYLAGHNNYKKAKIEAAGDSMSMLVQTARDQLENLHEERSQEALTNYAEQIIKNEEAGLSATKLSGRGPIYSAKVLLFGLNQSSVSKAAVKLSRIKTHKARQLIRVLQKRPKLSYSNIHLKNDEYVGLKLDLTRLSDIIASLATDSEVEVANQEISKFNRLATTYQTKTNQILNRINNNLDGYSDLLDNINRIGNNRSDTLPSELSLNHLLLNWKIDNIVIDYGNFIDIFRAIPGKRVISTTTWFLIFFFYALLSFLDFTDIALAPRSQHAAARQLVEKRNAALKEIQNIIWTNFKKLRKCQLNSYHEFSSQAWRQVKERLTKESPSWFGMISTYSVSFTLSNTGMIQDTATEHEASDFSSKNKLIVKLTTWWTGLSEKLIVPSLLNTNTTQKETIAEQTAFDSIINEQKKLLNILSLTKKTSWWRRAKEWLNDSLDVNWAASADDPSNRLESELTQIVKNEQYRLAPPTLLNKLTYLGNDDKTIQLAATVTAINPEYPIKVETSSTYELDDTKVFKKSYILHFQNNNPRTFNFMLSEPEHKIQGQVHFTLQYGNGHSLKHTLDFPTEKSNEYRKKAFCSWLNTNCVFITEVLQKTTQCVLSSRPPSEFFKTSIYDSLYKIPDDPLPYTKHSDLYQISLSASTCLGYIRKLFEAFRCSFGTSVMPAFRNLYRLAMKFLRLSSDVLHFVKYSENFKIPDDCLQLIIRALRYATSDKHTFAFCFKSLPYIESVCITTKSEETRLLKKMNYGSIEPIVKDVGLIRSDKEVEVDLFPSKNTVSFTYNDLFGVAYSFTHEVLYLPESGPFSKQKMEEEREKVKKDMLKEQQEKENHMRSVCCKQVDKAIISYSHKIMALDKDLSKLQTAIDNLEKYNMKSEDEFNDRILHLRKKHEFNNSPIDLIWNAEAEEESSFQKECKDYVNQLQSHWENLVNNFFSIQFLQLNEFLTPRLESFFKPSTKLKTYYTNFKYPHPELWESDGHQPDMHQQKDPSQFIQDWKDKLQEASTEELSSEKIKQILLEVTECEHFNDRMKMKAINLFNQLLKHGSSFDYSIVQSFYTELTQELNDVLSQETPPVSQALS